MATHIRVDSPGVLSPYCDLPLEQVMVGASSIAVACRLTRSFWDIVFGRAMSLSMERLTKGILFLLLTS